MSVDDTWRSLLRFPVLLGLAALVGLLACAPSARADGGAPTPGPTTYIVQRGDTWNSVSLRTGVSVAELMRLNPKAIHPRYWLWIGDRLLIPAQADPTGYWYQVKPGDTWVKVAKATGVPVRTLWQANPGLLNRRLWLYIGQRVWVPAAPPTPSTATNDSAAAIAVAGALAGAGAPTTPPAPPAQATPAQPALITPTQPAPAGEAQPTATATPARDQQAAAGCPAALADYPAAITAYLNDPSQTLDGLRTWLVSCQALVEGGTGVTPAPLQSATSADVVVTIADPADQAPAARGMLLVYHAQAGGGYTLARAVDGMGQVALLRAGDVNADGKADVIWTDTTCGAHTCTATLHVDSWDGAAYQSWIEGSPELASADYAFQDVAADGSGEEILAQGGVVGSAGAGPQRAWTEMYASPEGGPYKLIRRDYESSPCLYHAILDANAVFDAWDKEGFDKAIAAYRAAADNQALTACWTLQDETTLLRDYAEFRLAVAHVANGQAELGAQAAARIVSPAMKGVAEAFLNSYRTSGSVIQACRDTTDYAVAHPDAWRFLADWGYANPTFTAEDLCPLK